nr:hypothetical protein [Tanacetum cinerariifolium]
MRRQTQDVLLQSDLLFVYDQNATVEDDLDITDSTHSASNSHEAYYEISWLLKESLERRRLSVGLESKVIRECCFVIERDAWLRGLIGDVIGEDDCDDDGLECIISRGKV